ncbi:protein of unknown function (plasmid) [Pararobbsia alpina]
MFVLVGVLRRSASRQNLRVAKGGVVEENVVRHLAKTIPERFSATSGPSNRVGKVYVDYLRNGIGQTTAAAFSAVMEWAPRCPWHGTDCLS